MIIIINKKWIKYASIRAIRTFAQTMLAMLPIEYKTELIDLKIIFYTSIYAGFISILTSMVSLPEVNIDKDKIIEYEEEI